MSSGHALVVLFDVTVLLAIILFLCTLLPAVFSKSVQRSIGWYSLMTAWLTYSLSYGLLIGRQEEPIEPPLGLCLFQTLLVYAVPPLVAVGTLCYYIEFYLIVSSLRSNNPRRPSFSRTFCLAIAPWLVFLMIILEVLLLVFPGKRLHLVDRAANNFYCHLENDIPNQVTAAVIIAAMVILIPLEVWTGISMYRNWEVFKRLSRTDRQIFITVYLRLILCTIAAVIAFAFSMLAFVFPAPDATSLAYPTLPIFIAFAFGTQRDLLQAWLFWRPSQPYGSIVFNGGTVITTNVYTSWGAQTTGISTETQTQEFKPSPAGDPLRGPALSRVPKTPATLSTSTAILTNPITHPDTPLVVAHPASSQTLRELPPLESIAKADTQIK
ncbi:hypothetical protein P691DRAFT_777551 [Macrolepiota fuliginosa MF-IS2]|uniref:Uncharacterized protein n=1 Tax=Macrolepiota fuliginosa MF-IS2 TaxID=1400762 RepID=A0A9P6BYS9_9AGAR|nr:hypothetical protein P691DRAFT_777551 [Macrolepiota fuliginosa MF-IS2]